MPSAKKATPTAAGIAVFVRMQSRRPEDGPSLVSKFDPFTLSRRNRGATEMEILTVAIETAAGEGSAQTPDEATSKHPAAMQKYCHDLGRDLSLIKIGSPTTSAATRPETSGQAGDLSV